MRRFALKLLKKPPLFSVTKRNLRFGISIRIYEKNRT